MFEYEHMVLNKIDVGANRSVKTIILRCLCVYLLDIYDVSFNCVRTAHEHFAKKNKYLFPVFDGSCLVILRTVRFCIIITALQLLNYRILAVLLILSTTEINRRHLQ